MQPYIKTNGLPRLVWVFPGDLSTTLDAATWLSTTDELRSLGWQVDLLTFGKNGRHHISGVEVFGFAIPDYYFIRHVFFHACVLFHLLWNWGSVDVVLFHQASAIWLLPLRLLTPFTRRHPLFAMDSRTVPMESLERATFKDKIRGKFSFLMNRLANGLADGQTAITHRMANLLCIPPERLWGVWSSGVNPQKFSVAASSRHWPLATEPIRLVYIGNLAHERNLMMLCRAIMEANQRGAHFSMLLYGDGTGKQELQIFAGQTQEKIKVFEPVPHDQVPDILSRAHVGVLPFPDEDKFRVSSPIKLFEYMGAGLPVLATKIVCHTDVIGDGDYVFWAENAGMDGMLGALEKTWQARDRLPDLGWKAQSAAQNWTYVESAKKLRNALQYGLVLHWVDKKRDALPPVEGAVNK